MKKAVLVVVVGCLVASSIYSAEPVWLPASGWTLDSLLHEARLTSPAAATWTVTVTLNSNLNTDPAFLSPRIRYANGSVDIPVWRQRGDVWCRAASLSIPATPGAQRTVTLNFGSWQASDSLVMEGIPLYTVAIDGIGSSRAIHATAKGLGHSIEGGGFPVSDYILLKPGATIVSSGACN